MARRFFQTNRGKFEKMKTKTFIAEYDHYILISYMILILVGLYMQLNISSVRSNMSFFYKQVIWFAISLFFVWFAFKKINLEKLRKYIPPLLIITLILLILVLIIGKHVKGGTRFFPVTIPVIHLTFNVQPSLLARIMLILYFAHILDKKKKFISESTPKSFLKNFNQLIVIPILFYALILLEKHFSPIIISGSSLLFLLYLAKIRYSTVFTIIGILLIFGVAVITFGPKYRNLRMQIYAKYSLFLKVLHKSGEYTGNKDYQIRESLVSLAGGKFFGVSSKRGTGKHYFLPEAKTDYIYSIIGEEWGFFGAFLVMGIYLFLFYRIYRDSVKKESLYLQLTGLGLGMNIFFNAMVNIGVAMSALPSTGVTLPFVSYGGTSLIINSFSIGLLLNISAKKRQIIT